MAVASIDRKTKFYYALSAVPFGIKEQSFNAFLMLYYNQVLGLSPILTGTAILIALCIDAITDPTIGHFSDNLKSRFGRRHPLMYAAAIPTALAFILLWYPPAFILQGSSQEQWPLFAYLVVSAILTRGFLGLFEIPSSALLPEISKDYDQRTGLANLRMGFGWISQITIAIISFVFFLVPTESISKGVLNPQGYKSFALLAGAIILITMIASAMGTHKKYARSTALETAKPLPFITTLRTLFRFPNFKAIFFADIASMTAFGVSIAMQLYFATFLFDLTNLEIAPMGPVAILGALFAMWLTPRISKSKEKRRIAIIAAALSLVFGNAAIPLRILGWFPENGSTYLIPSILVLVFFSTVFVIIKQTMMSSMTADLIEALPPDQELDQDQNKDDKTAQVKTAQVKTARVKTEGMFFAAISFSRKTVTGLGVFLSGLILSLSPNDNADFAEVFADPTGIPLAYIITVSLSHITTIFFLTKYTLTREQHGENIKALPV